MRRQAAIPPTEKIKKLMGIMDLRALSCGFLTQNTLVVGPASSVPQARLRAA